MEASTIRSPLRQPAALSTAIWLAPAFAVFASLVQLLVRSPCRLKVPPSIMMPRSPIVLMSSLGTVSVSVMVASFVCGRASLPIASSPPGR